MRLVGFIIEIYYDARPYERQIMFIIIIIIIIIIGYQFRPQGS